MADIERAYIDLILTEQQEEKIKTYAALGYSPSAIARRIGLEPADVPSFIRVAQLTTSKVYDLIRQGQGDTSVEEKLLDMARTGDPDAVEALQKVCNRNRFFAAIEQMDDDEFNFAIED